MESNSSQQNRPPLLAVQSFARDPLQQKLLGLVGGAVDKVLALDGINQIYYAAADADPREDFLARVLRVMNIETAVAESDLARIPKDGRFMAVANHPFGGIEGIVLGAVLGMVRPDVKLMANFLLKLIPDLHEKMIFVDPFDRDVSAKVNLRPIKECVRWMKDGHALGVFPAGAVSHMDLKRGGISDPAWSLTIARLIRMAETPVVPVFFRGNNSLLFQVLGMVHPRLRTGMLAREIVNKRNRTIEVRIGNIIPFKRLAELPDDQALMDYLRLRTYHLRRRAAEHGGIWRKRTLPIQLMEPVQSAVADPEPPDVLQAELDTLPPDAKLLSSGSHDVYVAEASQIPHILLEIGRLREVSFRAVKEGTGRTRDLDRFDDYYLHVFAWNRENRELVGAYRLGQTDLIVRRLGVRGLYTSTLFRYRKKLLTKISPALEMGRSFVAPAYQKNFSSLLLLWKGVGAYIARNPRYRMLFGPVSISNDYQSSSRKLMVSFLRGNTYLPKLARMVKPRRPLRMNPLEAMGHLRKKRAVVADLDEVEALIGDLEADMKGVPVLLRQYLRLGGKLLGFSVDPDFSDVLDGLILVDLAQTAPSLVEKYLGREGSDRFFRFHGVQSS